MISKSQIKLITSLQQKKYRNKTGLFVAEGPKIIKNLIAANIKPELIFSSETHTLLGMEVEPISQLELQKMSALKTANTMLAVFRIPKIGPISSNGLTIVLDAIRDPGNLGTIIRLCDWFGVEQLVCSMDTVGCFNPKVVQATMGSIAKVQVHYVELSAYLKSTKLPVYAAVMDGVNVYKANLPENGILVMGNEANGISEAIQNLIQEKITIPQFVKSETAESLNVATATGILLNEFRRNFS